MCKLSIITVNLNNAEGLRKTIESVVSQTFTDFEYIVIDGSSIDSSVNIIKQYADKITYWVSEPDKGIYNAMNKGILQAKGEYCLFMNSGDWLWHDNVLKEIFSYNLYGDIVCGHTLFEKSEFHKKERIIYAPGNLLTASKIIVSSIPHQSTLLKTKLFKEIHLYDESYSIFADGAFFIEMMLIYEKKYQKINVLISVMDTTGISSSPQSVQLIDEEFKKALKNILPDFFYQDYVELFQYHANEKNIKTQLLNKVGNSYIFRILLYLRRKLIKWGVYSLKKKIKKEYNYFRIYRQDKSKKKQVCKLIYNLPLSVLPKLQENEKELIVSLTSYGKRVKSSVAYTIYTLFKQSKLPHRIVLFLDYENWNDDNLPKLLKRLQRSGLEIYYCEDIRSYKKLIPAMEKYPDSIIITVDDDVYYNPKTIEELYTRYLKSDKKSVICHWAAIAGKRKGKYILPSEWKTPEVGNDFSLYSPIGVGGILYPSQVFDFEIFKREVFFKYAPTTDDLWFWIMELRNNVNVILLKDSSFKKNRNIDNVEQMDDRKSDGLFVQNAILNGNDKQLRSLLEYYNL